MVPCCDEIWTIMMRNEMGWITKHVDSDCHRVKVVLPCVELLVYWKAIEGTTVLISRENLWILSIQSLEAHQWLHIAPRKQARLVRPFIRHRSSPLFLLAYVMIRDGSEVRRSLLQSDSSNEVWHDTPLGEPNKTCATRTVGCAMAPTKTADREEAASAQQWIGGIR